MAFASKWREDCVFLGLAEVSAAFIKGVYWGRGFRLNISGDVNEVLFFFKCLCGVSGLRLSDVNEVFIGLRLSRCE